MLDKFEMKEKIISTTKPQINLGSQYSQAARATQQGEDFRGGCLKDLVQHCLSLQRHGPFHGEGGEMKM